MELLRRTAKGKKKLDNFRLQMANLLVLLAAFNSLLNVKFGADISAKVSIENEQGPIRYQNSNIRILVTCRFSQRSQNLVSPLNQPERIIENGRSFALVYKTDVSLTQKSET